MTTKSKPRQRKERGRRSLHEVLAGVELIKAERLRQISQEGWTPKHDDGHVLGEMLEAAKCYAHTASKQIKGHLHEHRRPWSQKLFWPWDAKWWKPSDDTVRNLVKAGALIAAEIDRLERLKGKPANAAPSHAEKNL